MVIRECTNSACGFRYPDLESDHEKAYCPKCGHEALIQERISPENALPQEIGRSTNKIKVVLDNIRSIYNTGSIFRTADGFGVEELLLCGITPTPQNQRFSKTSLGSEEKVKWSYHPNALKVCQEFQNAGNKIIALESTRNSISLYETGKDQLKKPFVLVVGNENIGVDPAILRISDRVLSIPMLGIKESFNVATAFGIAISYFYSLSLK
jgi:23S rRNA (guanosine2251-2'-O)-methyltransferase